MILRIVAAIAWGVVAGGIAGTVIAGDPLYTAAWTVALTIALLASILAPFAGGRRTRSAAADAAGDPKADAARGNLALARVESVRRTGLTIGDQPQVELRLTVAPDHRGAFSTAIRPIVDIVALPRVQPGAVVTVSLRGASGTEAALVLDPPAEWAARAAAEAALPPGVRRIPAEASAAFTPQPVQPVIAFERPRPIRVIGALVLFLLAAAITLAPSATLIGRQLDAVASGDHGAPNIASGVYQQEVVAALEAETGDTRFTSIAFYDEYALASAPSTPGATTIDRYEYRWGRTSHAGPDPIQPGDPAAELFDASEIDFSLVRSWIGAARAATDAPSDATVQIVVERGPIEADGTRPIRAVVLLDSDYTDSTVVVDPLTGQIVAA